MVAFDDEAALLAANDKFYAAFSTGDQRAMEAIWSQHHAVACIHPGWGALEGREAVIASWRAILDDGGAPVQASDASAYPMGDAGFVVCRESLQGVVLAATNVFVRERGEWKIVHHQASPIAHGRDGDDEEDDEPKVLN
jgi:hypothetical protein